jgi:hypothetical protein
MKQKGLKEEVKAAVGTIQKINTHLVSLLASVAS